MAQTRVTATGLQIAIQRTAPPTTSVRVTATGLQVAVLRTAPPTTSVRVSTTGLQIAILRGVSALAPRARGWIIE